MSAIPHKTPGKKSPVKRPNPQGHRPPGAEDAATTPLPKPIDVLTLLDADLPKPPELVHGVLHRGSKMVIGGGSKSFKTWTLIDLAVSVAAGVPWWGFNTTQGRVLYMNFEIQDVFFRDRVFEVMEAKDCGADAGQLMYWGLRGKAADLRQLMPEMIESLRDDDISLIVFDPIYKGLGDRDENRAGDIASLLNEIEKLAVETGAAVAFGHHFSKGNQSGKESIDRMGGSGVFARDPDTIMTMTRHTEDDAFTVDAVLRNFAPVEPFVVVRRHPLMIRDDGLDPTDLKQVNGVSEKYSDEEIQVSLINGGLTATDWMVDVMDRLGMAQSTFHNRRRELVSKGLVKKEGKLWTLVK